MKGLPWTTEQVDFLRQNAGKMPYQEISEKTGHPVGAVKEKLGTMGLTKKSSRWTDAEIALLRRHAPKVSTRKISMQALADMVGHSKDSTASMMKKLGLCKPRNRWTAEDDDRLRTLVEKARESGSLPLSWIATQMDRNAGQISAKVKELGLNYSGQLNEKIILSPDQEFYIRRNHGTLSIPQIAKNLGLTKSYVEKYLQKNNLRLPDQSWTQKEDNYLEAYWGIVPIETIQQKLHRSYNSILKRTKVLGLGSFLAATERIHLHSLYCTIKGIQPENARTWQGEQRWIKYGLPYTTIKSKKLTYRMVDMKDFWEWAKEHRPILDFADFEPFSLGEEPDWVEEKRLQDQNTRNILLNKRSLWTPREQQKLKALVNKGEYTRDEIAEELRRPPSSVERQCKILGLQLRPKTKDKEIWTTQELDELGQLVKELDIWAQIGAWSGRGETSCRNKALNTFGTSDIIKLRQILGNGSWPYEADIMNSPIRSRKNKPVVKTAVAGLCLTLHAIIEDLDPERYGQSAMCQHWSPTKGCLKHSPDCDTCVEFERIKPQYCAICGDIIISREPVTFCPKCTEGDIGGSNLALARKPGQRTRLTPRVMEILEAAIKSAVRFQDKPFEKASKILGIPMSTLRMWARNRYGTSKVGDIRAMLLSEEQEEQERKQA